MWAGALALCLALGIPQGGEASTGQPITLAEALETALEHNTSHALFLWEQELAQKREEAKRQPVVEAQVKPAQVRNGEWADAGGSVTITVPLGRHLGLSGALEVGLGESGLDLNPSGTLTLRYDFFALSEENSAVLAPEETRQRQVNSLVLQVFDLFVDLRQAIDERDYRQAVVGHVQKQLEAAQQTPGFDDLELRRKLRSELLSLAAAEEKVNQLQLQLQTVLGWAEVSLFEPLLEVGSLDWVFSEPELQEEVFAASVEVRTARRNLEQAQAKLDLERKTGGWQLTASGTLYAGEVPRAELPTLEQQAGGPVNWNIGLSASKTLYPHKIVLEELELAVAKAEHELAVQENALLGRLRSSLQAIRSAQNLVESQGELLRAAEEDLALRQRQYAAGLVTELQVEEAALAVHKARNDYYHQQLAYARSVLALWDLCGRRLQDMVFAIVS